MEDLSSYFAKKICEDVQKRVAEGSGLPKGTFNPEGPRFRAYNDFEVRIYDGGNVLEFNVDHRESDAIGKLEMKLSEMSFAVPQNHSPFVTKVSHSLRRSEEGDRLVVEVRPKLNRQGKRKNNKEKMYLAVVDSAWKNLFRAIYDSSI